MIELCRLFKEFLQGTALSASTVEAYVQDISIFFEYLHKQAKNLSKEHVLEFMQSLKQNNLSSSRIARILSSLKIFWSFLHKEHHIDSSLADIFFPKIGHALPFYCSVQDKEKLIALCDQDQTLKGIRAKLLVHILFYTGVPLQALVLLKQDQIILTVESISFIYKKQLCSCPLDTLFYEQLLWYKEASSLFLFPVFFHPHEPKQLSSSAAWVLVKKMLLKVQPEKKLSVGALSKSLGIQKKLEKARAFYDKAHPRS